MERPQGNGGLEIRKITAKGWVCPRDESLLLLKREIFTREPALDLSLACKYNHGIHKAKATPGSVFRKRMEEKTGFFFHRFSGDWYKKNSHRDLQLSGRAEST